MTEIPEERPPTRRPPQALPEWIEANGYTAGRQLDDELWLVINPAMIGAVQLAVCTPPPDGGKLEFWDYDDSAEGTMAAVHAFMHWPERDMISESWERHVDPTGHDRRRQGRAPDAEPEPPQCYLNIEEDPDGWHIGTCDCGRWVTPMGCPGPEEVANAWGDHLRPSARPNVIFVNLEGGS